MLFRSLCYNVCPVDHCIEMVELPSGREPVTWQELISSQTEVTDDMRAPLAFLLGKLDFHRDFREFRAHLEDGGVFITAIPKSNDLPYSEVSFLTGPDFAIRRLDVKNQDNSVLKFAFENEKQNPPLAPTLFEFTPPRGAEFVDSSNQP